MQTDLVNNRQTRRRVHVRPNLTIMKGTIADLKFIRYGDMVVPVIMGKERKKVINSISPQGLNNLVNNWWNLPNNQSSSGDSIQLLNNGSVVATLGVTFIPVLNGSTVIWLFIANDLSGNSYTANEVQLNLSILYAYEYSITGALHSATQYSSPFTLATATTNIVKTSSTTISFIWEIQINFGSSALAGWITSWLYAVNNGSNALAQCCGGNVVIGARGGATCFASSASAVIEAWITAYMQINYIGGSTSQVQASVATSFDGTNTYLVISATFSLSSSVQATSVEIFGASTEPNGTYNVYWCVSPNNEQYSAPLLTIPYNASLPSGSVTVTVTIEFSPAT